MQQEIISGCITNETLPANATEYSVLQGGHPWNAAESDVWQVVSAPGTLTSFLVETTGAPGGGESWVFTIRVNGAAPGGGLVVTIAGVATQGLDRTNFVNLAAGDYIDIQCVGSAGAAAGEAARWSVIFTGTNPGESLILGGHEGVVSNAGTAYSGIMGGQQANWTNNVVSRCQIVPTNGTISRLFVRLSASPGIAPEAYRFRLNVNGVVPAGTPDVTITAPATTGSDLINSVVLAPGDRVVIQCDPVNAPTVTPTAHWGFQFDPTIDGESLNLGGTSNALNNAVVEYTIMFGERGGWGAVENQFQGGQVPPGGIGCILRKFYVWLAAVPGAGTTWQFDLRRAGDSGVVVTISDLNQLGSDLVNDVTLADYDDLTIQSEATVGAPANTEAHWGLVGYINPGGGAVPSGGIAGKLIATRMI